MSDGRNAFDRYQELAGHPARGSRYFATVPVSMAARVPLVSGSPSGALR
jgi:hypothetical protein